MCVADPCFNVQCDVGDYCSNGNCVPVCTTCMKGQTCVEGICQADPCNGVTCAAGQVCSPTGSCVQNVCAELDLRHQSDLLRRRVRERSLPAGGVLIGHHLQR